MKWIAPAALGLLAFAATARAQTPVGEISSSDASVKGAIVLSGSGTRVMSGSSVVAGDSTVSMRLQRGGEVRICPHSSLSLNAWRGGRDLQFGMSPGAIETSYALGESSDTVVTPDFRVLLAGPGVFHFAVGADNRGNTCIRALPGNTASLMVTELMGDGVYQVRANDQVTFRNGQIAQHLDSAPPDCGCPQPLPVMRAQTPTPAPVVQLPAPAPAQVPAPATEAPAMEPNQTAQVAANSPEALIAAHGQPPAQPTDESRPVDASNLHAQVEAPFVFRGDDVPPPPLTAHLALRPMPDMLGTTNAVGVTKPRRKGIFGHVRSFFAAIFH
jgi:hypothetical protein